MGYKPLFFHLPWPYESSNSQGPYAYSSPPIEFVWRLLELLPGNIIRLLTSATLIRHSNRYTFFEYWILEKTGCKRGR